MSSHALIYAPDAPLQLTTYTLLELPSDLLALVEASLPSSGSQSSSDATSAPPMIIKGQADDDAVLCTADATHALRACVNSNSLLLCQPAPVRWDDDDDAAAEGTTIEVVATLHQTLECLVTRPRVERLDDLLGDYLWTGEDEERLVRSTPSSLAVQS